MLTNPAAEHEIQIRMLGNAMVYVTCRCLERKRAGWKGRTISTRYRSRAPQYRSLGDFEVGTPVTELIHAYNLHLPADSLEVTRGVH